MTAATAWQMINPVATMIEWVLGGWVYLGLLEEAELSQERCEVVVVHTYTIMTVYVWKERG
jgi:hypothetical protein